MSCAVKERSQVEVVGVQTARLPSMRRSAGERRSGRTTSRPDFRLMGSP